MHTSSTASTLNKVLAFGLALSLVAWTFGVFFVLPAQAVEQHPNGTLVLSGSTIFKVMDGQRLGFPSAEVFLSHGYQWGQVVPANSADLALPQGSNVQFADGTLVNDGGTVFIVSGGMKYGFTSASVFTGLGYSFANVVNASLSGYTQGADVSSATQAHPAGTFVNSNGTIFRITATGRAGVPSAGHFFSWGGAWGKVVPANAADLALSVEPNVGFRVGALVNDGGTVWAVTSSTEKRGFPSASCYLDFGFSWSAPVTGSTSGYTAGSNFCGTDTETPPASSTGVLTVTLASDTPASGIAIKSAQRVPFTKVNLTATGGDVVVDSWVVERLGVASDSSFSGLDIVDLSTNSTINDTAKSLNSSHQATFSEDLTVKNGTTKSVYLTGSMAASPGSGEQPKLGLKSITVKGSASVNGSFPIVGNAMTINTSITIGTATIQRGAYTNATNTALEVGRTAYTFFSFQVQAGAAEDVAFAQVKVYQQGSAGLSTDLANIKLYRDGTFLADGVVSGNYVSFSFPAQIIPKGQTYQYQVKADVVDGSARTIDFGIYRAADMLLTGQTYNANIAGTFSGTGSAGSSPVLSDNTFTISTGSLRVGTSNTVGAENITVGSDQVLGAFEFEAKGEPINVTALTLTVASSTSGTIIEDALQAVKVVDSNGVTVAGPTDITNHALTVAFTDTFTVPVGVNHYKIVGTLYTSGGWTTNDTITVSINTPASAVTARGDVTGQTVTPTPSSNTSANQQTVKTANVTVTKNSIPTNKTVIKGSTGVLAGAWTIDATNSGEDIRITSVAIRASTTSRFNTLTLKKDGVALSPVNDNPVTSNNANTTSTFALSNPIVVSKGSTSVLELYVNVPTSALAGEVDSYGCNGGCLTAYGVTTGNTATVTTVNNDGATLTVAAAGTLTVNLDASVPSTRQVVHGSSGVVLTEVRLKATNEPVNITKLTVRVADGALTGTAAGTFAQLSKFYIKKNGATVGSTTGYVLAQASTQVNLGVNDLQVPEGDTGTKLSVLGDVVQLGTNQPGTANADIKVGLNGANGFTAKGAQSNTAATITYNDSTGNPMILHKAIPSVVVSNPGGALAATSELIKVSISAVGDDIGVYRLSFTTSSSTGIRATNAYIKLGSCDGTCGGISAGSQLSATGAAGTYHIDGRDVWTFTIDNTQSHGKRHLAISPGSTAHVVMVSTITGFTTNSDSISTSLLGDTATTTDETGGDPAAEFTVNNQGNFVWSDLNSDETQAASSLTANQWYNGYYVTGLGATVTSTAITLSD